VCLPPASYPLALTEPQGPTHIEAASEVLLQQVAPEPTPPAAYRNTVPAVCDPAQIDAAWAMISKAEHPLFVIGRGVMKEQAVAAMEQLATATGIPVAVLQYSPDAFPSTHPLALGPLGRNAFSSANRNAPKADVIVAIGAHFDVFSTMYKYGIFSETAKINHHTAAPGQIGHVFPGELAGARPSRRFHQGSARARPPGAMTGSSRAAVLPGSRRARARPRAAPALRR